MAPSEGASLVEGLDFEALADEAERGYDVSDLPPTTPEVWIAEPVSRDSRCVVARVVLLTRGEADQALSGGWRVVQYRRADL